MSNEKTTAELIALVNRKYHLSEHEGERDLFLQLKKHLRHQEDRLAEYEAALKHAVDIREKDTLFFLNCAANCRHTTESEETEIREMADKVKKNRQRYASRLKQALQHKEAKDAKTAY